MSIINKSVHINLTKSFLTLSPANKTPKYSFIFLHGLDMHVHRFISVFLSHPIIDLLDNFRIHVPQAPIRPIEYFRGREGPSWHTTHEKSFLNAVHDITHMVQNEVEAVGHDSRKVFLGGFSQGSALALHIGLELGQSLGGVIMVGGYMSSYSQHLASKPNPDLLVVHGLKDEDMPWPEAERKLKSLIGRPNVKVELFKNMGHNLSSDEAKAAMYKFLRERAPSE